MKAYGEEDAKIHIFLIPIFYTTVLVGDWSVSGPGRFTTGKMFSYVYVINYYAMKAYVGVVAYIHVIYTPVLFGVWSGSSFGRFTPGEKSSLLK
jgi:hypothetical protein